MSDTGWPSDVGVLAGALRRLVGPQPIQGEYATVDHVSGGWVYVKRAGQSVAIPIRIASGCPVLAPNDGVLIERPHGDLFSAIIRTKT